MIMDIRVAVLTPAALRSRIVRSGYSGKRLAEALGITQVQVARWCTGRRPVPPHHVPRIIALTDNPPPRMVPAWRPPADMPPSRSKGRRSSRGAIAGGFQRSREPGVAPSQKAIVNRASRQASPAKVSLLDLLNEVLASVSKPVPVHTSELVQIFQAPSLNVGWPAQVPQFGCMWREPGASLPCSQPLAAGMRFCVQHAQRAIREGRPTR